MALKSHRWRMVLLLTGCLVVALGGVYSRGVEGEPKKEAPAAKAGEDPGKKTAIMARPLYKAGPDLHGNFDRTVLRGSSRVTKYRYPLEDLRQTITVGQPVLVRINCVLEMGSEAGMAEIDAQKSKIEDGIRDTMGSFRPQDLMTVPGKIRLKEAIVAAINHGLTTARVRQVYLTDFLILK